MTDSNRMKDGLIINNTVVSRSALVQHQAIYANYGASCIKTNPQLRLVATVHKYDLRVGAEQHTDTFRPER